MLKSTFRGQMGKRNLFRFLEEFHRMTKDIGDDCQWQVTHENERYKICETYPKLLIVPKGRFQNMLCDYLLWKILQSMF